MKLRTDKILLMISNNILLTYWNKLFWDANYRAAHSRPGPIFLCFQWKSHVHCIICVPA